MEFTPLQTEIIEGEGAVFCLGRAGTGKTTALRSRLEKLIADGNHAFSILYLVSDTKQVSLLTTSVQEQQSDAHGSVTISAYNQFARDMVELFWPIIAHNSGFQSGSKPPVFLPYDMAQLMMWQLTRGMFEDGKFADLRRRPQQIVSQMLDTLNRAALNQLDILGATEKQIATWAGDPQHATNLHDAASAAQLFRQHCYTHNLLDLSLVIDTFQNHVLESPSFLTYFQERFRHLLVDNVEEFSPAAIGFLEKMMETTDSAVIAYDENAGYRTFLGGDPTWARRLGLRVNRQITLTENFHSPTEMETFTQKITGEVYRQSEAIFSVPLDDQPVDERPFPNDLIVDVIRTRYRRDMVYLLADRLYDFIREQEVAPSDIAIITPLLDGALRFGLIDAFQKSKVPINIVRRRGSPREEPRVRAWLTLLSLANPSWNITPSKYDVAEALALCIDRLDLVRASMLVNEVFSKQFEDGILIDSADSIPPEKITRIGEPEVALYQTLRVWMLTKAPRLTTSQFIYQLFTDILSDKGYMGGIAGEGVSRTDIEVCNWITSLATRLEQSGIGETLGQEDNLGRLFINTIDQGLVTAHPPNLGVPPDPNGITISTAQAFMLSYQPVKYQVWLETAASAWWDLPRQPLSNAFVLSPQWQADRRWEIQDEFNTRNLGLHRLINGLTSRTSHGIILATSDLDRRGVRQEGALWKALVTLGVVDP